MKFLFDLFPVILFFAAYKFFGIFTATAVAMGATLLQITWVWLRHRKVPAMLWVSFAIITVFGGATLYLHNETFIKWKPTVLYWLFAVTLTVSATFFKKNFIRSLMKEHMELPDTVWGKLNASWAGFFALVGFLNLYIAFTYSTDTWVNFKLFGTTGLMAVFVILQGLLISKYLQEDTAAEKLKDKQ